MNDRALLEMHSAHSTAANAELAASQTVERVRYLAITLMIKHLHNEHGMKPNEIAKQMQMTSKQVKVILGIV